MVFLKIYLAFRNISITVNQFLVYIKHLNHIPLLYKLCP